MKTSTLFKTLVVLTFFVISATSLFAQVSVTAPGWNVATQPTYGVAFRDSSTETPIQATNIDTVTVGSVMPYMVKGDPNMLMLRRWGALTNKSFFSWTLDAGGTLYNTAGNAFVPANNKDTVVLVEWTSTGSHNLRVTEIPDATPAFCTGTSQLLPIQVLDRPTIKWYGTTTVGGGCNVKGTTVKIPVDLTGIGEWEITYDVTYTDMNNATQTVGTVTGTDKTINYGNAHDKSGLSNQNVFSIAIPSSGIGTYGKYEIKVTAVSDRISRKSGIESEDSDIPAKVYTVYSYPAPTTQPIQHIKNIN